MQLAFKCSEACLYFDEQKDTYVVVDKDDMKHIVRALSEDLVSQEPKDRMMATNLICSIQKYKWTSIFLFTYLI